MSPHPCGWKNKTSRAFLEVSEMSNQTPSTMGSQVLVFSVRLLCFGLTKEELVLSLHPGSACLLPPP